MNKVILILKKLLDFFQKNINKFLEFSTRSSVKNIITIVSFFVITGAPIVYLIMYSILLFNTDIEGYKKSLSLLASLTGIITFLGSTIVFFHKKRQYLTKARNFNLVYLQEFQSLLPVFEKCNIDLTDKAFINYSNQKLLLVYIDLFESYESFEPYGYKFYSDFIFFLSKFYNLSNEKIIFLKFLLFQNKYKFRREFIDVIKDEDFLSKSSDFHKAIKLLYEYNNNNIDIFTIHSDDIAISEDLVKELYENIVLSHNSGLLKIFNESKKEKLRNNILQHVIDETYSIISTSSEKNINIFGPCLLIKNEENFSSWWSRIEKEAKFLLRNDENNNLSDNEIEEYSIQKIVEKENPQLKKQPFSIALKSDPYIQPFLDFNLWSPLFIINSENLPLQYRNKPIEYIEKVVKKNAQKHLTLLIKSIKKVNKSISTVDKELIFDYELIPFDFNDIKIRTRPDSIPKVIQNYYISSFIDTEKRGQFVEAHLLQIRKVLDKISPISLVLNSCNQEELSKLRNIEIDFLKKLDTKKRGNINFEGINNIITNINNKNIIIDTLWEVSKSNLKNNKFSKEKCKQIVNEIMKNSKYIKNKIEE